MAWLVGWLFVVCLLEWLTDCLDDGLFGWLIGRFFVSLLVLLTVCLFGSMLVCVVVRLFVCPIVRCG